MLLQRGDKTEREKLQARRTNFDIRSGSPGISFHYFSQRELMPRPPIDHEASRVRSETPGCHISYSAPGRSADWPWVGLLLRPRREPLRRSSGFSRGDHAKCARCVGAVCSPRAESGPGSGSGGFCLRPFSRGRLRLLEAATARLFSPFRARLPLLRADVRRAALDHRCRSASPRRAYSSDRAGSASSAASHRRPGLVSRLAPPPTSLPSLGKPWRA